MTERKDLRDNLDADRVCAESVRLLPQYGWPEWPPEEVPQPKEEQWWQEEIFVPPKGHRLPIIEVGGLPQAGKSSLIKKAAAPLTTILEGQYLKKHLVIFDEQLSSTEWEYYMDPSVQVPSTSPFAGEDHDAIFWDKEWLDHLQIQLFKTLGWEKQLYASMDSGQIGRRLFLGIRGPVDVMVWFYALATHQKDPSFTIPSWYREDLKQCGSIVAKSQQLTSYTAAVVLVGLSQKEAEQRRQEANRTYPGVTESPFFLDFSAWCAHWIENVWPKTRERKGTGLLVLNGENSLEHNTKVFLDYCRKVVSADERFLDN
jgi:hypothetical protein